MDIAIRGNTSMTFQTFPIVVNVQITQNNVTTSYHQKLIKKGQSSSGNTIFSVSSNCMPNYYADTCNVFCVDGFTYTCDRDTGKRICKNGYKPPDCTVYDICTKLMSTGYCLNNGSCAGNSSSWKCVCPKNFEGPLCERRTCFGIDCGNGTCVKGICKCNQNYMGVNCKIRNICKTNLNICNNRGTCSLTAPKLCHCNGDYTGAHCEKTKDKCSSVNCSNGGRCDDATGNCKCPSGYTGKLCLRDIDECKSGGHKCSKQEICINNYGNYTCIIKEPADKYLWPLRSLHTLILVSCCSVIILILFFVLLGICIVSHTKATRKKQRFILDDHYRHTFKDDCDKVSISGPYPHSSQGGQEYVGLMPGYDINGIIQKGSEKARETSSGAPSENIDGNAYDLPRGVTVSDRNYDDHSSSYQSPVYSTSTFGRKGTGDKL